MKTWWAEVTYSRKVGSIKGKSKVPAQTLVFMSNRLGTHRISIEGHHHLPYGTKLQMTEEKDENQEVRLEVQIKKEKDELEKLGNAVILPSERKPHK